MFGNSGFKLSLASIVLFFLTITSPLASAEMGYRYWGYFQAPAGAMSWTAALTGPSVEVKDGDVEGWAFSASGSDIPAATPMMDPDFASLCGEVSEIAGKVRVGLVVDFGAGEIAPSGETPREFFADCVLVPKGSVGIDVLSAALEVRTEKSGLICGIAGYPSQECGAEIDLALVGDSNETVKAEPLTSVEETRSPALIALALVALLVGVVALRRRSK